MRRLSERQYSPDTREQARQLQERDREVSALLTFIQQLLPLQGAGSPENVVLAPVGTLFLRTDGGANTTLYVKESGFGNTGWVAK